MAFETFSQRTHKVILRAQEEARRFGHAHLGTAHLLLGLSGEDASVAAHVLRRLCVEVDEVREQVDIVEGRGLREGGGEVPLTPRAKRVLEAASQESRRQGHGFIATDHLLLALLGEGGGISARVLLNLEVDPDEALQRTQEILRTCGVDEDDPLDRTPWTG